MIYPVHYPAKERDPITYQVKKLYETEQTMTKKYDMSQAEGLLAQILH